MVALILPHYFDNNFKNHNFVKQNITMKIANPIYDVVFKYLMENNEIAKDILSVILNEEIVSAKDPRIARVVKYLDRAIINNPDLLHAMIMEDFMEAEAERERIEKERERIAKEEAIEAKKAAIQDKELAIQDKELAIQDKELAIQKAEAERKEKEFWKAQFEAMQQKNKDS